jgi:hypothetical protein
VSSRYRITRITYSALRGRDIGGDHTGRGQKGDSNGEGLHRVDGFLQGIKRKKEVGGVDWVSRADWGRRKGERQRLGTGSFISESDPAETQTSCKYPLG